MKNRLIAGFTLAEVLITLTIIGVIAALTIPALLQNINQQNLRTQWKTAYSIIEQANKRALMDYGGSFKGVFINSIDLENKLKIYYSYTKECTGTTSSGNCWATQTLNKNGSPSGWSNIQGIVLNNGIFVRFSLFDTNCISNAYYSTASICGAYEVDVNGFKGPNTIGEDIYYINILEDRIKPAGVAESTGDMSASNCSTYGAGCGALYLQQ